MSEPRPGAPLTSRSSGDPHAGAAVALAALCVVATLGMGRIFAGSGFVVPTVAGALAAFGLSRVTRHRATPLALLVQAAGLGLVLCWAIVPSSTWYGLPTGETWTAFGLALSEGLVAFREQAAPVAPEGGLLLLAVVGAWLAALVAHELAFRLDAGFPALVGPVALFAITSALGTPGGRVPSVFVFSFAALAYLAAARAAALPAASLGGWGPGRTARSVTQALPLAALLAAGGIVLGPNLPGAGAFPLVDWREGGIDRTRVTVSPLVDLRARLTSDPKVELFTVRSAVPAYWRLTALEEFDGRIWSSSGEYRLADGWTGGEAVPSQSVTVRQRFSVGQFDSFWLPAAFRPISLTLRGARVDVASSSLVTESATASGMEYEVESRVARYGAAALETAPWTLPTRLTRLPADFPRRVARLAADITKEERSPYGKAKALQDWLRTQLEYDQSIQAGHSNDHLSYFLFESRRGYCEQFAGAFAAMARSVGLPSRIAVGFTPGTYDPRLPGYRVTTSEAHAWPEVRLEGFGWVAFEPTPGRADTNPADHTGTFVPPAASGPDGSPLGAEAEGSVSPAEAGPGRTPRADDGSPDPGESPGEESVEPGRSSALVVGAVLVVLLVLAVPLSKSVRRSLRRHRADPLARLGGAWTEALERLRECGLEPRAALTPLETADDLGARRGDRATEPLARLASLVTEASFSTRPPSPAAATEAWRCVRRLSKAVDAPDGAWARLRRRLHPGTLLRPGIGRPGRRPGES